MLNRAALSLALLILSLPAWGQSFQPVGGIQRGANPVHFLSTASTNSTLICGGATAGTCQAGPHIIYQIVAINTTATIYYLKLYDKPTAPSCGSDTPVLTLPVPFGQTSSGGGFTIPIPVGTQFLTGIGICLVGGIADNDSSNAAAGVAMNFWFN